MSVDQSSHLNRFREAQHQWQNQVDTLISVLLEELDFMVFRESTSYLSFVGTTSNDMSQKVIIDLTERKISVQEIEYSNCVTQCVFTTQFGYADHLAKQVIAVVKSNRE